jgi:hypothetical protein
MGNQARLLTSSKAILICNSAKKQQCEAAVIAAWSGRLPHPCCKRLESKYGLKLSPRVCHLCHHGVCLKRQPNHSCSPPLQYPLHSFFLQLELSSACSASNARQLLSCYPPLHTAWQSMGAGMGPLVCLLPLLTSSSGTPTTTSTPVPATGSKSAMLETSVSASWSEALKAVSIS